MQQRRGSRRGGFKGDGEGHVDELIRACEKKPMVAVVDGTVKERELVPFFDMGYTNGMDTTLASTLEWPDGRQRRRGHYGKYTNGHSPTHQRSNTPARFSNNKKATAQPAQTAVGNKGSKKNMKKLQDEPEKFAGPAFTVSPVPESVPLPSFIL